MRCSRPICVVLMLLFTNLLCSAQQLNKKMSNQDVTEMVSLGLSDDVIIDKIHGADATDFDTSISALKTLKAAKVSDNVIRVMINPHASLATNTPAAVTANPTGVPEEIGIYVMKKGKLTEIEPEVVGWQSGGVMKSMATYGLTKGHVNGKIMKPNSPLQVPNPIEFLIKTPEGTSVTEYQLLRLDVKSDRREFRAMTGGIMHESGGAEKNAVGYESQKIATRTWRIQLSDLKKGEYGFLPPGCHRRASLALERFIPSV
jgi:hypothetical protein